MIYVIDLVNKRLQSGHEGGLIMVDDHIQVNPMLPTCEECFAVMAAVKKISDNMSRKWN